MHVVRIARLGRRATAPPAPHRVLAAIPSACSQVQLQIAVSVPAEADIRQLATATVVVIFRNQRVTYDDHCGPTLSARFLAPFDSYQCLDPRFHRALAGKYYPHIPIRCLILVRVCAVYEMSVLGRSSLRGATSVMIQTGIHQHRNHACSLQFDSAPAGSLTPGAPHHYPDPTALAHDCGRLHCPWLWYVAKPCLVFVRSLPTQLFTRLGHWQVHVMRVHLAVSRGRAPPPATSRRESH